MGKSNKKKAFSSPAISTIHKIVSKNTKLKNDNTMSKINKSNFIKKNKSLVKLIKGTGSLIATVANQKSYHNGYEWNKKAKNTFSWFSNNAEWLKKKGKAGKDATFSWFGNNAEWLKKKGKAGKDATFSWFSNNAEWLKKKGKAGKNYLGSKWVQLKEWYKDIDLKEKFNNFFDFTGTINDFKDFGENFIEFGKKRGWGVHPKVENMWSSPLAKKIRSFGKRAFPILDFGSIINDVAQAPTIDEKIIELNKAVFSKVGSAGLSAVGGFLGSFIPAQPATVPALAYGGSLLGDYLGEKLGELSGKGLTKIWPKTWWPYKNEKTSKINPTKNLNLNKSKTHNLVGSINKTSPSQHINVTLPTGAIQISNSSNKVDYNGMVAQISAHFVKELRKAMENRKTIMA
ncbi:hypothetical protein [Paenibacillus amylolyticus]|uniref:hypothetical protein n=1 Tax=Paenibacillus amylolyticus TaxID=1451 RepID=UPI001C4DB580|nr:hypothetical protein [Paenibacillus amylolyticus]